MLLMPLRLRLPELMESRGFRSAYALAKASNGSLAERTIQRLVTQKGRVRQFDTSVMKALRDTLGVTWDELIEDEPDTPRTKRARKTIPKRAGATRRA